MSHTYTYIHTYKHFTIIGQLSKILIYFDVFRSGFGLSFSIVIILLIFILMNGEQMALYKCSLYRTFILENCALFYLFSLKIINKKNFEFNMKFARY